MGFPDGHLTELDRARKPLYKIFMLISFTFSPYFLYLGWISNKLVRNKHLLIFLLVYLLLIVALVCVDYTLSLRFDNGVGG